MPQLAKVLTEEDLHRGRAAGGGALDLAPYMDIIDNIREQGGVGGTLSLSEDESQRTEKRRMSVAAKERGLKLVWRRASERQLRFVLAEEGQPTPGGRPRRSNAKAAEAPEPAAANGRRGRSRKE